jgi:lipopolysaccharide export system protein LptA
MRMLVVGAGVLLLLSLLVFLAVGKWKNPLNRSDVPQRLGINVQQEAGGFTYSQSQGGRTLYKIHASKVVELKDKHATLHDVEIELYGDDGSRMGHIKGDEFAWDEAAKTATSAGAVEITLMRPGVAPAIAPKVAAGHIASDVPKGSPVASVVEAVKQGEIHAKTSGLTFDKNSRVASTSQQVIFSAMQGSGSSMGATFDSKRGLLVLDRAVELTAKRGDATVQIHAQHAEFERETDVCVLHAILAEYQGGQASAGNATVLFREDGSAVQLEAMNGFTLNTAGGDHMAAPTGQVEFDEHNHPRKGHLEGGVTMDSVSESGGGDGKRRRQLHGGAPAANFDFDVQGKLQHVHLEKGVAMDSEELSEAAGQPQRQSRHWRSPVADLDFRDSGHGQIEPVALRGSGGVVVTGESQRGKGVATPLRFSADEVAGEFGPGSRLTAMHGVGHASIEESTETGAQQTTSGDRIEAHFAVRAKSGERLGAKRGTSREGELQSASVEGHVVLTQQQAAKAGAVLPPPMRATAGRAVYEAAEERLYLTLSPRVENGAVQLTADKVDVSRASGDAFAHGNVKASWTDAGAAGNSRQGRPEASRGSVALGGQGPAHVVAAEAELRHATGEATFSGHARLWQQANSIAAPVIVLDHERQTLVARATNRGEPVLAVLLTAAGPEAGSGAAKQAGRSSQPVVIRVRSGDLTYSDSERKAMMHGGVLGAVVAETGTATLSSDQVEITLTPAGKTVQGQAQVDRMTARGHVVLTSEGRRGTGEQLVYTTATGEYVLTGTAAAPPRMTDPARGTVTGESLIFRGRDDSVSVEGGGSRTTTQTTSPK